MSRWFWVLLLLSACAGRRVQVVRGGAAKRAPGLVAVAPPVFWSDFFQDPEGDLWGGRYVGNVVFSGGFVTEEREGGLENRSAAIRQTGQRRYRVQASEVVSDCITEAIGQEGRDWIPAPLLGAEGLPAPERRDARGSDDDDGHDNQPLPRFSLTPEPWSVGAPVPPEASWLLVPVIVHYYAHNGGWFLGQTYGSSGGARARVLWTLYGADGAVVSFGDHAAKAIVDGNFSPNSAEVQDNLMRVERDLCRSLTHALR